MIDWLNPIITGKERRMIAAYHTMLNFLFTARGRRLTDAQYTKITRRLDALELAYPGVLPF